MPAAHDEYLLVDGYNIINAWPELEEAKSISLEAAREKLLDIMADYAGHTGIRVIVVFDAHQVEKSRGMQYDKNGVRVVFTKEGETADHYIEKLADLFARQEKVRVATSDWIEQQIILGRGATRISARELLQEVNAIVGKRRASEKMNLNEKQTLGDRVHPDVWKTIEKNIKNNG
ncbi:MAG: NYN domain-containing protein [Tepidanaerobacteraceae bacterium]|jgi:predicted RNA-binding protein with PIN domain|nr:NYN domain-containing protein [Tepidanaerobacteraceae bacterium]